MDESLNAKFQLLRTRIESELPLPAVILVTSASAGDGKTATARGLAECLSEVGRRVALVDANTTMRSVNGSFRPTVEPGAIAFMRSPFAGRETSVSYAAAGRFVDDMRETYEVTIIDGAAFTRSKTPIIFAGTADGVLITLRLGRAPSDEDTMMCQTLEHVKANLLGVVAVSPDTIAASNAAEFPMPTIEPRRPSTELVETSVLASRIVVR